LPDPVGAATRVGRRARIKGQARDCARVGPARNVARNQAATAGWKSAHSSAEAGAAGGCEMVGIAAGA
jgi:hypothetical protein